MNTLELHAHTPKGTTHVATVYRSAGDETPLQLVSAQRLAQLLAAEAELRAIQQRLADFLHAAPLG